MVVRAWLPRDPPRRRALGPHPPRGVGALARAIRARDEAMAAVQLPGTARTGPLVGDLDAQQLTGDTALNSTMRRAVDWAAKERIALADGTLLRQERLRLASEIADEVLGYGPIEPLQEGLAIRS
jgi:hypothetical protein